MNKITTIFLLIISTVSYGQQTVQFANSIRNTYNIPEISYAVVNSKSILEIAAVGRHSIDLPDTATLNDRFHIGSNTKAMTAFIIAKYVEMGKLDWATKFFDIYPEWKNGSLAAYHHITLQDLLSHKAGIQPFQGENDPEIPGFKGTNPEKRKQFGQFVLTLDPVKPDSLNPFVYSNAGYTLATLMVEKVARKSWEELVEKVLNKDLNLNIKLSWPENQLTKETWGHLTENDTLKPVPSDWDYHLDFTEPAGDINIKLVNYVKFIQLNLRGLEGRDNYLRSETYQFIHNGIKNYSLGWFNVYENGKEWSVHSGTGAFTYFTIAHIDRTNNIAFIIFTNSFNQGTQQGVRLLMRKLKENYGN
ncbi:serine hydrolase domain-containing protein [Flavihumibacter cheonanensis]|uniref:serine hydrolase domain-containing protein n=1 Tax=Flavihumibacter cheonanensis TaxID=1442385 RepID=UPI001EF962DA|nr:serine hydrolase domain-containing protein [Flavihumibacter cheonanensis]MCG7751761.1 beta-lactamase family protein [Flavihumibacter cheonanensis]